MSKNFVLYPIMFLSYSSRDREFVERLARDLSRSGVTIWYDQWMMKPGDKLRDKINRGIDNCKYFGVVISNTSLSSNWLQNELDAAMVRFIEDKDIEIVPILIKSADPKRMPPDLRGFVYADFRRATPRKYRQVLDTLVDKLTAYYIQDEPTPTHHGIVGPADKPLEDEIWDFATSDKKTEYSEESIASAWPLEFCTENRGNLLDAINHSFFTHYGKPGIMDLVGLFFSLWQIHNMKVRHLPSQMLRLIDDTEYTEEDRAVAIHAAGWLDYPLGESRICRLLSETNNKVVYSVCEYLEYRVGLIDSEAIAQKLIAIVNRPDRISYFTGTDRESDELKEGDIRYFAARCLVFVELDSATEELIVSVLRKNIPEIEDKSFDAMLNSILLGAVEGKESRLWKRYSGSTKTIFDRFPAK